MALETKSDLSFPVVRGESNSGLTQLYAHLQLMRPANIVTAWADILAGFTVAGGLINLDSPNLSSLGWLLLATTGLYGGGIVFNDVFDAELDAQERPERPIPSGRASRLSAIYLGSILLILGIGAAAQVSFTSLGLAIFVALAALVYDAWGKHTLISPLNMGLCRGGNLLLGVSWVPELINQRWSLALIPIIYIAAITAMAKGEVHGGKRSTGILALGMLAVVLGSLLWLGLDNILIILPFWLLLTLRVLPAWIVATRTPQPALIGKAVKAGVISLILLDATLAASFGDIINSLVILSLLPLSLVLAKRFAVT